MPTGHHAAVSGGVRKDATVAVVGGGAVGLCAVIAAKRLGASRIVAMSCHPDRQELARQFGATGIVPERGDAGVAKLNEMFEGIGPDVALECVGTKESMDQALRSARPGGQVGFAGVPELPVATMFNSNVGVRQKESLGGCRSCRSMALTADLHLIPKLMVHTVLCSSSAGKPYSVDRVTPNDTKTYLRQGGIDGLSQVRQGER